MCQLVTSRTLDRESVSEYTVQLVCHDLGRPSLSTSVLLDVIVTDINDNPPVFLSDTDLQPDAVDVSTVVTYVAELFENNFIGAFVAQVNRFHTAVYSHVSKITASVQSPLRFLLLPPFPWPTP